MDLVQSQDRNGSNRFVKLDCDGTFNQLNRSWWGRGVVMLCVETKLALWAVPDAGPLGENVGGISC